MNTVTIPEGLVEKKVQTSRLNMNVLMTERQEGIPVILLHGNFSSAIWWRDVLLSLPEEYYGIAPDMRGYGWTEDLPVDASKGMGDWVDDLVAFMDALKIEKAHFAGWSLAGGILLRFIVDHPDRILSVTLEAPVSPYGFGGTKDVDGTPTNDAFSGCGGGVVNADFVRLIKEGDRSTKDQNSPRNVINGFYYKAPFECKHEEDFLTGALMEKMGDDRYPGDLVIVEEWPTVGPGKWGPINAGSAKHVQGDADKLINAAKKKPILWIRGAADMIVSDTSFFDLGFLGQQGYVPGWPGDEVFPPQPMVSQTRAVLEKYKANGGDFEEVVIEEAGHAAHVQQLDEFNQAFHAFLSAH